MLTPEEIAYGYQEKSKLFLFLPSSQFRSAWDWVIVFLVFFNAVQLPFELALNPPINSGFLAFTTVVDVIFGLDIVLNCFTTYKDSGTHFFVNNYRKVAQNYVFKGWFIFDILAVFPFDLMLTLTGLTVGGSGYFRLTKNIRLLRMTKLFQQIKSIGTSSFSNIIRLSWMVLLYVLITHWFACAFAGVGLYYKSLGESNWIEDDGLQDADVWGIYITSLYWGSMTVTTVGYGDFTPVHPMEQVVVSVLMVVGSLLYAVIFGNISLYIANLSKQDTNWQESTQTITAHMDDIGLPGKLKWKVLNYHDYLWNKNHGQSGSHFKDIPQRLQVEVAVLVHGRMLRSNPAFGDATDSFINSVAMKVQFSVCLPNEYVFEEGELANSIYFLARGQAGAFRDQFGSMCIYKANSYFGECPFLVEKNLVHSTHSKLRYQEIKNATAPHRRLRSATFRAFSVRGYAYCDLWKISWNDFADALYAHKDIQELVVKISKERMQRKTFYDDDMLVHKVTMKLLRNRDKDEHKHRKPNFDDDSKDDDNKSNNKARKASKTFDRLGSHVPDDDDDDDDYDDDDGAGVVPKKLFQQLGHHMGSMDGVINDVDSRTLQMENQVQMISKKLNDMESNLQQGYFRLFQNMRDASAVLQMVKRQHGGNEMSDLRYSNMSGTSASGISYNSFFTNPNNGAHDKSPRRDSLSSSSNASYQVGITPPISQNPSFKVSNGIPENKPTVNSQMVSMEDMDDKQQEQEQEHQEDTNNSSVTRSVKQSFAARFARKSKAPLSKRFKNDTYLTVKRQNSKGSTGRDEKVRTSQQHLLGISDIDDFETDDDVI